MKAATGTALAISLGLLLVAAVAPSLIALSDALVPLILVVGVVALALRLVFFHTRRW